MSSIHQAVVLNNQAVDFLQNGNRNEAISVLRVALATLKDGLDADASMGFPARDAEIESRKGASLQHENSARHVSGALASKAEVQGMAVAVPYRSVSPIQVHQQLYITTTEDFVMFFDRAMRLDEVATSDHGRSYDVAVVTSVVLYNWSLIDHMHGMKRGISSLLAKSLSLYSLAEEMISKIHQSQTKSLLLISIINNIAHINALMLRLNELKETLRKLRFVLNCFGSIHVRGGLEGSHLRLADDDDVKVFLANAAFSLSRLVLCAPAA